MISALVTTYNEADTIGPLVAGLLEVVDRVLVVDDRMSSDNTEQIAAAFGAQTLVDATGIGPCLLSGFRYLRGDTVVVIDAGGSHDPQAIRYMQKVDADVVIGSRFVVGGQYHGRRWRAYLSRLYSRACSAKTGHAVKDWTSGYRIYSPYAVNQILARPSGTRMHGFQPDTLARLFSTGLTIREYPIVYRAGRTSMNLAVAREAWRTLRRLRCS